MNEETHRTFDKQFKELSQLQTESQQIDIVIGAIGAICGLIRKYMDKKNKY